MYTVLLLFTVLGLMETTVRELQSVGERRVVSRLRWGGLERRKSSLEWEMQEVVGQDQIKVS